MGPTFMAMEMYGHDRVLAGLAALEAAVKDLRPFWRNVFAPKYFAEIQDRFAVSGRLRGGGGQFLKGTAWAPLSPAYAAWKRQHFPGEPILTRTGRLRESLRWTGSGLGAGGVFDAQPDHVIVGTRVPYGVHHMTGTKNMPARPFIGPPDPSAVSPLLKEWILREHGRGKGEAK